MSDNFFIDTNIFVYSFSDVNAEKRALSKKIITRALSSEEGMISTQVIQEFINVALHKFKVPINANDCKEYVKSVLDPLCTIYPDIDLYLSALDIKANTNYRFFDSLIIAAAIAGHCKILYSEDMHHNHKIRNLTILNPFITDHE